MNTRVSRLLGIHVPNVPNVRDGMQWTIVERGVQIPVIASGVFADGHGLAAALLLA